MDWETQYQAWVAATTSTDASDHPERLIIRATRKECHKHGKLDAPEAWAWVDRALGDPKRKWFIAHVFNSRAAPKRLGERLLQLGVYEHNPSANRYLVEPAVHALGATRVYELLLQYLQSGTAEEKAGAASACYWVRDDRDEPGRTQAVQYICDEFLRTFANVDDVNVRRRILPMLSMKPEAYSEAVRPLLPRAVEIARRHPDDYIRHRIEIQLGANGPFKPIPQ